MHLVSAGPPNRIRVMADAGLACELDIFHALRSRGSQPLRMATLDPIQKPGPERPQQRHIVGEQYQADWNHPEPQHRKKTERAAADQ